MKRGRIGALLCGIFLLMGLVFLAVGIGITAAERHFFDGAEPVTAVITSIDTRRGSDGDLEHEVYVSYTIDGKGYEGRLNAYHSGMAVGGEITVYCRKDAPENPRVKTGIFLWVFGGIGGVFALGGGIGLIFVHRYVSRRRKVRETGRRLYAQVTGWEQNLGVSVNHRHPYVITCQYLDPVKQVVHVFRSDYLWYDPTPYMQGITALPVMVDPADYRVYAVETEGILPG